MQKRYAFLLAATISIVACSTPKKAVEPEVKAESVKAAPTIPEPAVYRGAAKRVNDLLHSKLEVSFDYGKQYLYGKATLTFKPYFNNSFYLDLNAVGFDIKEVSILKDTTGAKSPLTYKYDGKVMTIKLDRVYSRNETFKVFIDYVAKPNEVKTKGSMAITNDKGLYFVNPLGRETDKPTQIWTQGETQANSCWFPTLDSPNERMTQEIYMTVENKYVTLSNGLLISSKVNANGTRTDYWKQTLPAAPYLTMMAVGDFAIVKDRNWQDKEIKYYVEKSYAPYAKAIFGNTPEMIEFFSKRLGVDYPWEKFSQIVVRDYVSGAMENTSAVLHGEFLQRTDRELLDNTNEDVVSHELFHQWFGDLVTCESWSNITLNESFATYGEYLWNEFKYGQDKADYGLQNDLNVYVQQKNQKDPNLVRFDYEDKEDVFDGISYQKGGRILHMLRRYVGDDAFFESLKLYLTKNKFNSAEAHNLRLAFEEVTGEDLNWFFNQWYFNHGSPDLDIKTEYSDTTKEITVTIEQKQDFAKNPLFKLPLAIDVYNNGKPTQYKVTVEKVKEVFTFESATRPDFVNVDGEKSILCTKHETKPAADWIAMYKEGPLYMDRYEAIQNLAKVAEQNGDAAKTILDATSDKFWNIRSLAIRNIGKVLSSNKDAVKQRLMDIANNDEKSQVRAAAIRALVKNFDDAQLTDLYRSKLREQSYIVQGEALEALGKKQPAEAINLAKSYELEKNADISRSVTNLYIDKGNDEQNTYFLGAFQRLNGFALYSMLQSYGKFLARCSDETITRSLLPVEDIARKNSQWYVRLAAVGTLNDVMKKYEDKEAEAKSRLIALKAENPKPTTQIERAEAEISDAARRKEAVTSLIASIKKDEKDPQLMKIYGTAPEPAKETKDEKKSGSK